MMPSVMEHRTSTPQSKPPSQPVVRQPGGIFLLRGWLGILTLTPLGFATALSVLPFSSFGLYGILWSTVGALLILTGVLWRTWAMFYVGGRKSRTLVQTGPYSLSRHPLYFGTFLVGLGAGVMLQSLTFVAAFLVVFPIIYLPVIQEEERVLHWNHPNQFERFRLHVRHRFLPSLRRVEMGDPTLRVHVKAQWNQAKRGLLTLAAIPLLQLLQTLRSQGSLPVWFSLP